MINFVFSYTIVFISFLSETPYLLSGKHLWNNIFAKISPREIREMRHRCSSPACPVYAIYFPKDGEKQTTIYISRRETIRLIDSSRCTVKFSKERRLNGAHQLFRRPLCPRLCHLSAGDTLEMKFKGKGAYFITWSHMES